MLNSKFQQRTTYITVLEGGLFFLGERAQVFESRRIKNNTELNKKCKYHFQMPPAFETLRDRVRIDAGWYKTFQQQINIRGEEAIVVQNFDEKKIVGVSYGVIKKYKNEMSNSWQLTLK